jgi:hypothetical protein
MEKIKPSEAFIEEEIMGCSIHPKKLADAFDTLAEKVERLQDETFVQNVAIAQLQDTIRHHFGKKPEAEQPKQNIHDEVYFGKQPKEKTLAGVLKDKADSMPNFHNYCSDNILFTFLAQAAKEHFARMIDDEARGSNPWYQNELEKLKKRLEAM